MKADTKTEAMVMEVVNQFVEAFTKRDIGDVLALFAPDPDVVFIGTGVDEKRIGLAEIKAVLERDFAQSEEISLQLGWYSVSVAGSVAWVATDGIIRAREGPRSQGPPADADSRPRRGQPSAGDRGEEHPHGAFRGGRAERRSEAPGTERT